MKRIALAAFVIGLAPAAGAQEAATRLTLEDAITRGIETSHRLAELRARAEGAGGVEAGQQAARLPAGALLGGYTRTNHVDEFGLVQPGQPPRILYPDIPDNYRTRLDLQWPIYSAGRTDALERAAHAERQAVARGPAAAAADLPPEVTRACWALVTADETERVLALSLDSIAAHVRDLQSRLDQGLIPPNELLSAQAEQSHQRLLAIEARNGRAVAEADLRRL